MKTKRFNHWKFSLTVLILAMFIQLLVIAPASAEISGPGWVRVKADPVSLEDSRAYYKTKTPAPKMAYGALAVTRETAASAASGTSTTVSPEIIELARALKHDPKLIYDYVHNHIDYVPYFGLLKGATLTLLDGSGNDFDQAALMVALLRESGYTTSFVHGVMYNFPEHFIANWLGVDDDLHVAQRVLSYGGIPGSIILFNQPGASINASMERVWVKATIDGTEYVFDPACKWYEYTEKIDIGAATGYSRSDFLNAAKAGATITGDYIQNLNDTNVSDKLAEYTSNLISTVHSQYPNSNVREIIGGRRIIEEYISTYSTSLPHADTTVLDVWSEIPDAYTATVRIQHEGIDHTFKTPEIAGKRMTMTYAGGNFIPELRLDGEVIATGNSTSQGNKYDMTTFVDHPYAAYDGTYCDRANTWRCQSGFTYAIVMDFGGTTDELILKRQRQLSQNLASGLGNNSEQVLGETLNIMALTWMKEDMLMHQLSCELAEMIVVRHHNLAVMAQEAGYRIDVHQGLGSIVPKHNVETDDLPLFFAKGAIGSAFEHAILEQLMGSDKPGVSTIKLMHLANSQGSKVYWANSANFDSIKQQLHNYSAGTLNNIQGEIDADGTVMLPDDGKLQINQWRGAGYMSWVPTEHLGMYISGGYNGGYGGNMGEVEPEQVSENVQDTNTDVSCDIEIQSIPSAEPVDMATGAYMYDRTDIALGNSAPMGLQFSRSYNSSRKWNKRSIGHGWQHNYDIFLKRISDCNPGLGLRTPVDAAAMITNLYISLDLMQNEDNLTGWMVMFLAHKWAVDQLIDNAISVNIGGQVTEYRDYYTIG